jgi:hypothetical protein
MDAEQVCVLRRAVVREGGAGSDEDCAVDEEGECKRAIANSAME